MGEKWLAKTTDAAKTTWNVICSVGPFLVSQSESMSQAFARHQARLGAVEAGKKLLFEEIDTFTEVKRKLLARYVDANEEERVRIRRDIKELDDSLRQVNVAAQAMNYLPASTGERPSKPPGEVSAHWMDKFAELVRMRNEDWRADLLARALATESASPGTVSPRVLWLIGTLEEDAFHAFAILLDLSASIGRDKMIASHGDVAERVIPECFLGNNLEIGRVLYQLDDVGLLAEPGQTTLQFNRGTAFSASYGTKRFIIKCPDSNLSIRGVMFTQLGSSLALFYEPKVNPLGQEIFDEWIATLDKTKYPVQQVT